ncbi:MAG: AsnC family protein [endosymbiont of Galathealinum brachiosum]|uniref:siroheme decarboxylase n=1 Tax=endosymbiont of Galathealinum brachiosum TaxID=2200906 RepID=A0A370DLI2_9GAMM|nr:MAG: AsnC family protein [endosymbiont of Galathealinum brachiosum]
MRKIELTQRLLNEFQHNFPVTSTPYADIAERLNVDESTILELLKELDEKSILSRVGPVFRPNRVGVSTLAAMAVPEHKLEHIADIISSYPAVNHNYEREHHFNLWFVVTAENQMILDKTLEDMELKTDIRIMSLPMEKDYHIDLGFPLKLVKGGRSHD